jgi:hypothetical protein
MFVYLSQKHAKQIPPFATEIAQILREGGDRRKTCGAVRARC